jgi:hypothetical protein
MRVEPTHFNSILFCQFDGPYWISAKGRLLMFCHYITSSASALRPEGNELNVLPHNYVTVISIFWDPIELLTINKW